MKDEIGSAVDSLGNGPLTEPGLREHIWPLFRRVMEGCQARREIYLANHSLGRPLDQVARDVAEGLELWYSRLDESWAADAWPAAIDRFRALVAELIGLSRPDAVVPKTSAGQGLRAVLNALPGDGSLRPLRIVSTRSEFDSVDFILKTYSAKGRAEVEWVSPARSDQGIELYETSHIINAIDGETDLVVVSQVCFSTGQNLPDLPDLIAAAHERGSLVLVDVYHAAGVIPLRMEADEVDFMIGGSYKYTRGGPGACWLAIHPKHLDGPLKTLDTGWFAKRDPFSYERDSGAETASGGDGWLESTPPVITAYQAYSGLRLTLALGVQRLRDYSLAQQEALRESFLDAGIEHFVPERPEAFGAFSLVPSSGAAALSMRLKAAGVNTDSRGNLIRFGPDILNSRAELTRAAEVLAEVTRSK